MNGGTLVYFIWGSFILHVSISMSLQRARIWMVQLWKTTSMSKVSQRVGEIAEEW